MKEYLYNGINPTDSLQTLDLLGGKGYHLSKLKELGAKVPPFFAITTLACRDFHKNPDAVVKWVKTEAIPEIKKGLTDYFGYLPLVSVRSGAKISMPGMMDTILNVGLTQDNLNEWRDRVGLHCAQDSYKRLQEMYKDVVGVKAPQSVDDQLLNAIVAVLYSWNNERAKTYRKLHKIDDSLGTAVVIQAMVFGNMNDKSCTGVLFTRDPSTGDNNIVGEFLPNAQGEDVVAGKVTPKPIYQLAEWNQKISDEIATLSETLEKHFKDMQDIEFTVQNGELFVLQTRNGKRTGQAAIRIALDLVEEGLLDPKQLGAKLSLKQYLLATQETIKSAPEPSGVGIGASNGVVRGIAVLDSASAVNCKEPCILVTDETTPDDILGMNASKGILTRKGGLTSHAAVVARGMGKVCVVGCTDLPEVHAGDKIVLCGLTGRVWINQEVEFNSGADNATIKELHDLLHKTYGYIRLTTDPKEVQKTGTFFSTLNLDEGVLKTSKILDKVVSKMEKGLIDLRGHKQVPATPYDSVINEIFLSQESTIQSVVDKIAGLPDISDSQKEITVLVEGVPQEFVDTLLTKGYKIIPTINTLEDFILANGWVVYGTIDWNLSAAAHAKLIQMKKAAGDTLSILGVGPKQNPGANVALSDLHVAQQVLAS